MSFAGLLLAAGAGRRMGGPKALLRWPDAAGPTLLEQAVGRLLDAGCSPVLVVLGCAADEARAVLTHLDNERVRVVEAADWAEGLGASLRAGVRAASGLVSSPDAMPDAVLVTLVDLPGVTVPVLARVAARAAPDALVRATFGGVPGHPVAIGREHWPAALEVARGDRGARDLLAGPGVVLVECGDLGQGGDLDTPSDLRGRIGP